MSNGHREMFIGVFAAVGLLLLVLGAPRLIAGVLLLPYGAAVADVAQAPAAVPDRDLELAALGRSRALDWRETAQSARDLTALRLAQALRAPDDATFDAALEATLTAAERSLSLSPAQPIVWYNLAYARLLRDGPRGTADAPLRQSLLTGSYDPRLLMSRIDLALATWRGLSPATQALVAEQIVTAYVRHPDAVVELAQRRRAAAVVFRALEARAELAARFAIDYGRAVRRN